MGLVLHGHLLVMDMDSNKRAATYKSAAANNLGRKALGHLFVMDSNKHDGYKSAAVNKPG